MGDSRPDERTNLLPTERDTSSTSLEEAQSVTWYEIIEALTIICLIPISYYIAQAAQISLYQSAICSTKYKYRERNPAWSDQFARIREPCTANSVNGEVSFISGGQKALDLFAGFIASFNNVRIVQKYGRKSALTRNLIGHVLSLVIRYLILYVAIYHPIPIELTWISSVCFLFVGGPEWRQEVLFMLIGGRQDDLRTTYNIFAVSQAISGFSSSFSMRTGAYLMTSYGIYLPLFFGFAILLVILVVVQVIPSAKPVDVPEPLPWRQDNMVKRREMIGFLKSLPGGALIMLSTWAATETYPLLLEGGTFQLYISKLFNESTVAASKLQAESTFMNSIVFISSAVVVRVLSASHFEWRWRPIRFILSSLASVAVIYIIQGSAVAQAAGYAIIGRSKSYSGVRTGLLFCALGQPLRIATRCTLISMTGGLENNNVTWLFSTLATIDIAGGAIINLLQPFLYRVGLKHEGFWFGLLLFLDTCLLALLFIGNCFVNTVPQQTTEDLENSAISVTQQDTTTSLTE